MIIRVHSKSTCKILNPVLECRGLMQKQARIPENSSFGFLNLINSKVYRVCQNLKLWVLHKNVYFFYLFYTSFYKNYTEFLKIFKTNYHLLMTTWRCLVTWQDMPLTISLWKNRGKCQKSTSDKKETKNTPLFIKGSLVEECQIPSKWKVNKKENTLMDNKIMTTIKYVEFGMY